MHFRSLFPSLRPGRLRGLRRRPPGQCTRRLFARVGTVGTMYVAPYFRLSAVRHHHDCMRIRLVPFFAQLAAAMLLFFISALLLLPPTHVGSPVMSCQTFSRSCFFVRSPRMHAWCFSLWNVCYLFSSGPLYLYSLLCCAVPGGGCRSTCMPLGCTRTSQRAR